ncbi:unnamed protein product [Rhizophagus irregularis]|nr:unnamed protein product [Rhizophagus irregularis]
METNLSNLNISNNDIDTINNKNCLYRNKPFIEELWCKECISSLEKLVKNGDKVAMFNLVANKYRDAKRYYNGEGTEKNLEKALHWYQKQQ